MRTRSLLKAVLGAVATTALLAGGAPLAAADAPAATAPSVTALAVGTSAAGASTADAEPGMLFLTVAGTAPNTAPARTVTLDCGGGALPGDHPDAAAACAELLGAQGDFSALVPSHTFCPALYLPVTATAAGLWGAQPVVYQKTFINECALQRATGRIFAF